MLDDKKSEEKSVRDERFRGMMGVAFRKIFNEFEVFEQKIYQKTFFNLFHSYSKHELNEKLTGPLIAKFDVILATADNFVQEWLKNGNASANDLRNYNARVEETHEKISEIRKKIEQRQDTFLDEIRNLIIEAWNGIYDYMSKKLPILPEGFLSVVNRMLTSSIKKLLLIGGPK